MVHEYLIFINQYVCLYSDRLGLRLPEVTLQFGDISLWHISDLLWWLIGNWLDATTAPAAALFLQRPITQQGRWENHILILRYSTPTDLRSDWPSADKASGSNPALLKLSCPCGDSGTNGSCTDPDANKRALTSIRDLGPTCILMRRDQNQDTQWAPGCDGGDGMEASFSRCRPLRGAC